MGTSAASEVTKSLQHGMIALRNLYNPFEPVAIAPLIVFRILFGCVAVAGIVRFVALGWIHEQYVRPKVHFAYYGFEAVPRVHDFLQAASGGWSIYAVFGIMLLAAFGVMLGAWYRISIGAYFLTFTFVELIDVSYYLNHYYLISLLALLLCFVPAHAAYSLDAMRVPGLRRAEVPRWMIDVFKFQLALVYVYAGVAKMTHEWLFRAMPLRIWLPAHDDVPVVGALLRLPLTAFVFSWAGMLYDTTIVLWLLLPKTRVIAYVAVVVFHAMTGILFQIGMFPVVMIALTPMFFSRGFHARCLNVLSGFFAHFRTQQRRSHGETASVPLNYSPERAMSPMRTRTTVAILTLYVAFQLVFPWRYVFYGDADRPLDLLWTEHGYRFAWRVMLMEKAGTATFYVRDERTGREGEVVNSEFLTLHQEKQMAMQPDMILQFAHILRDTYAARGVVNPQVRAEVYVTLNARPSLPYVNPAINLATEQESWARRTWILPPTLSSSPSNRKTFAGETR
jgi:hypothetical protein